VDGPRRVRPEEIEELGDLLCRVFGFHEYYDKVKFTRNLRRPVHLRGARVIAEDGKLVSHALMIVDELSIHGCRVRAASIGGVCTDPDYRGRGCAGKVLEQSVADAVTARARVMIVSGDRSLYRRNHCVRTGDLLAATVCRDSLWPAGAGLSVRRVTADDWGALSPLQAAEPVRFVRSADFFSQCCYWWDCALPEIWLVASGSKPLGYLLLVPPWRAEHRKTRTVGEYAGSRAAIVDALPLIFEGTDLDEIRCEVLGQDGELAYLLAGRSLALAPDTLPGTHRVLNLPGLMRDIRPYLAARLPRSVMRRLTCEQEGEACRLSLGSDQVEMDLSQAARLVLGGRGVPRVGGDLGENLGRVFPIPFPMPGCNFI